MAQWIAHQTSNLGVAGSSPVEVRNYSFCFCIGICAFIFCIYEYICIKLIKMVGPMV